MTTEEQIDLMAGGVPAAPGAAWRAADREAIGRELSRRDRCEHGVRAEEWCEACRDHFRRLRLEDEGGRA